MFRAISSSTALIAGSFSSVPGPAVLVTRLSAESAFDARAFSSVPVVGVVGIWQGEGLRLGRNRRHPFFRPPAERVTTATTFVHRRLSWRSAAEDRDPQKCSVPTQDL